MLAALDAATAAQPDGSLRRLLHETAAGLTRATEAFTATAPPPDLFAWLAAQPGQLHNRFLSWLDAGLL